LPLSGLDQLCSARNSPRGDLLWMTSWMFTSTVGILVFWSSCKSMTSRWWRSEVVHYRHSWR
jgi:hypothetical protein